MVLAHENMEPAGEKSHERGRVSSPIGIPNAKFASLNATYQNIVESKESSENSNSPLSSPGNYGPLPVVSSSAPTNVSGLRLSKIAREEHHDSNESISEILDRLPDCSPAFSTVFSELVQLDEERRRIEGDGEERSSHPSALHKLSSEKQTDSIQSTPNLRRKELRFAIDETQEKMRPRASSHSFGRRPRRNRDMPSSTHSTPALTRRSNAKNGVDNPRPVNIVPKYKFVTETITISHEDIVKEQLRQEAPRNGFSSPKSIFGVLEEKTAASSHY